MKLQLGIGDEKSEQMKEQKTAKKKDEQKIK